MASATSRWWGATGGGLGAERKRSPRRARLELETLEGRQVLSSMAGHGLDVAAHVMTRDDGRIAAAAFREIIRTGFAIKTPRFYELFTGRRDPGLNAREATARVVRGNLVLTGTMQGRINTSPAGEEQESYYVFGINRGSSQAIAPFPGRPNVIFDAVVAVSVESEGVSASVTDLTKPPGTGTTDLPASAVRVQGKRVRVVVPLSLLLTPTPTPTLPLTLWRVNLWPRTELPPAGPETVASFVPENAMFRILVPRGQRR